MNIPVKYAFPRGSGKFYTLIKQFFMIKCFWDLYCDEKYYKGTDSILYFPCYDRDFIEWLKTLFINDRKLTEEEINYIYSFAQTRRNGKLELQENAKMFLKWA